MTDAARIADLIQRGLPTLKQGTLRFWGQWFGRPYDNIHTVTGASAEGDSLEVRFNNGETLRIVKPVKAIVGAAQFVIGDAAKLRWEWNAYGNPPRRRYFEEYDRKGDEIEATTDVDWYTPVLRPSATEVAVEIL
jgi:hypothetical protein